MKKVVLLICLFFIATTGFAQDYKFHSVFIYNFTRYIQWPPAEQQGDFVIGVLGSSGIIPHLEKMAETKRAGNQKFVIKKFNSVDEVTKCHMLFIPDNQSRHFGAAQSKLSGQPTLFISEKPGMGKEGSIINFIIVDGKYKFELNQSAAKSRNLKISSELTKFAILI